MATRQERMKSNMRTTDERNLDNALSALRTPGGAYFTNMDYAGNILATTKDEAQAIFNVVVGTRRCKTDAEIDMVGTSMFPSICGLWVVGSMGSIWLDTDLGRVAYYFSNNRHIFALIN